MLSYYLAASNMTPNSNFISACDMLAVGEPKTIAAKQSVLRSVTVTKPAARSWRSVWRVTTLFEMFGGILVVFYLFAVTALSAALLFYTFNR